jgi:hypothetical protein
MRCLLGGTPVPRPYWLLLSAGAGVALWVLERLAFGRSLGELVWRTKPQVKAFADRLSLSVFQATLLTGKDARLPGAATTAWALFALAGSYGLFLTHPGWAIAEDWRLDQSGDSLNSQDWIVTPFFYALGAWPRSFDGKPVFYGLPYAKGPPDHFVGHVIARWDSPDIRVVFEGPKTPEPFTRGFEPRENLYRCLTELPTSVSCVKQRALALDRHLREMKIVSPRSWDIRWLTVRNPAIVNSEQVQGVYISAVGQYRAEDRFVMILPNGANQAVTLDYPINATGTEAKNLFLSSLKSLRTSSDLSQGRRWVDERLNTIKLDELKDIKNPHELVDRIAEIQTVLISKISVDPKTYESYFHLAGTAGLLERYAIREKRNDWAAVAKPLIQSLYMYSKDLAPGDERTTQIENLWLQAKKN